MRPNIIKGLIMLGVAGVTALLASVTKKKKNNKRKK